MAKKRKRSGKKKPKGICCYWGCMDPVHEKFTMCLTHLDRQAATVAIRSDGYREAGKCAECGSEIEDADQGFKCCSKCRIASAKHSNKYRENHKKKGLCCKCSEPAVVREDGRLLCHCAKHRVIANRGVIPVEAR